MECELKNMSIPKIRNDAEISNFDDGEKSNSYLITLGERHWKVSALIYYVYCGIDGSRNLVEIKEFLYESYSLKIDEQSLEELISKVFVEKGILEGTLTDDKPKDNKMLWGRITLIPQNLVNYFRYLSFFYKKACLLVLGPIVAIWLLYLCIVNSNTKIISDLFSLDIKNIILCYVFIFVAGLVHEFGHSVALMYYNGKPGRIGVAVYFIMPVLFSNVSGAWKLKRLQRTLVDLGGMYLQGVFLVLVYFINTFTFKNSIISIGVLLSGFQILGNFNPFIKLDGYWVLADFLGITEISKVIGQLWVDVINTILHKPRKLTTLSKSKRALLYVYSIFAVCFFAYFFNFLFKSIIIAVQNIVSDVSLLVNTGLPDNKITFSGVINYLSGRISTIIVLIFFIRIFYILIKKLMQRAKIITQVKG